MVSALTNFADKPCPIVVVYVGGRAKRPNSYWEVGRRSAARYIRVSNRVHGNGSSALFMTST